MMRICPVRWTIKSRPLPSPALAILNRIDEAACDLDELHRDVAGERPAGSSYRFREGRVVGWLSILRSRREEQPTSTDQHDNGGDNETSMYHVRLPS